jgi:hypothetical protein
MLLTRTMSWVATLSLALVALSAAWFLYWRGQEIRICLLENETPAVCEIHSFPR